MKWRDLATDPPIGNEHCILLFPSRSENGVLYITSNPRYAIINGLTNGYTHWAAIKFAPTHELWQQWQEKINEK